MNTLQDRTILYILGSSHSGSTLLAVLLGTQPGILCLGEADVFSSESKRLKALDDRRCSCGGGNWKQCSFWKAVEQELQTRYQASLSDLDLSTRDITKFRHYQLAFWNSVIQIVHDPVLIDSSKGIESYIRLVDMEFPVACVYIQRSPYGVIWSEMKKGKPWMWESFGYLHYQMRARLALRYQRQLRIQYENLAKHPKETLRLVLDFLELDNSVIETNWRVEHQHLLRGNTRFLSMERDIRLDEEWRQQLSFWQKWAIGFIMLPLHVEAYALYSTYLRLVDRVKFLWRNLK